MSQEQKFKWISLEVSWRAAPVSPNHFTTICKTCFSLSTQPPNPSFLFLLGFWVLYTELLDCKLLEESESYFIPACVPVHHRHLFKKCWHHERIEDQDSGSWAKVVVSFILFFQNLIVWSWINPFLSLGKKKKKNHLSKNIRLFWKIKGLLRTVPSVPCCVFLRVLQTSE